MDEALLLIEASDVAEAPKFEAALDFFGVASRRAQVEEFVKLCACVEAPASVRLLSSAATFAKLVDLLQRSDEALEIWRQNVHSAFVVAGADFDSLAKSLSRITGDAIFALIAPDDKADWTVTDQLPGFCKSLSGLRAAGARSAHAVTLDRSASAAAQPIISTARGAVFLRLTVESRPVFISTADIIDVTAPLSSPNFDIRPQFFEAAPIVLYVKWAFSDSCWQAAETCACLVVDDPLLKPRYGFLHFERLLEKMKRVGFSTNIAFIPWNWSRSARRIVRLFQENPERFSLSVHGCDHTRGEFGGDNRSWLLLKAGQALSRMARHQSVTGLPYDHVMVFPQGVFSQVAIEALKSGDFIGAVNTEVMCTGAERREITIADYWKVAVTNYRDFPIFTRRYPSQGLENFAFDILLGKPCLLVAHHNDLGEGCADIARFVEQLNALNANLNWTNLTEVVRRSSRHRRVAPDIVETEVFGREAHIENLSDKRQRFRIRKRESAPETIKEIRIGEDPVRWTTSQNVVVFEDELNPEESRIVSFIFKLPCTDVVTHEKFAYKAKTFVRRYLSEVRDNYLQPMHRSLSRLRS